MPFLIALTIEQQNVIMNTKNELMSRAPRHCCVRSIRKPTFLSTWPGIITVYSMFSLNRLNSETEEVLFPLAAGRCIIGVVLVDSICRLLRPWPEGSYKSTQKSGVQSDMSMQALIWECIHSVAFSFIELSRNASKSRKTSLGLSRYLAGWCGIMVANSRLRQPLCTKDTAPVASGFSKQ